MHSCEFARLLFFSRSNIADESSVWSTVRDPSVYAINELNQSSIQRYNENHYHTLSVVGVDEVTLLTCPQGKLMFFHFFVFNVFCVECEGWDVVIIGN